MMKTLVVKERLQMPKLTRRQFNKLTLATATATTISAANIMQARKAHGLVPRAHGPVLTSGFTEFEQSCRKAAHNLNKVVTGWGAPWRESPDHVWTTCTISDFTIVRTQAGDITTDLNPEKALREIQETRFYDLKKDAKGADKLIIEIGNEPNAGKFEIGEYTKYLSQTIDKLQQNFPGAKLCSTALSPNKAFNPDGWYNNRDWRDQVNRCDFVGFHFYTNDPNGDFRNAGIYNEKTFLESLKDINKYWPGKNAIATEYSIRSTNPEKSLSAYDKGYKYAELVHFDAEIPSNLWGATYFHIEVTGDDPFDENVGTDGAAGYAAKLHG